MNTNVEYYEKMKSLQDLQHQNEEKRFELERQLNTYIKSDKRLAKLKAVRLQHYWKKICEDEKKSQWRNEQLLRDFDRVEAHMADLNARTEKLRTMKRQFEDHVERMYPDWKQRILHFQRIKEREETIIRQREAEKNRAAIAAQSASYANADALYPDQHMHQQQSHQTGLSGNVLSQMPSQVTASQAYQPHKEAQKAAQSVETNGYMNGMAGSEHQYENASTLQTLSTLPTGTGMSGGFSGHSIQATSTPHPGHHLAEHKPGSVKHRESYSRIEEESVHSKPSPRQQSRQSGVSDRDTTQTPTTQITQKQVNTFMTDAVQGVDDVYRYQSNPKTPSPRTPRDVKHDENTDIADVSDLGSEDDFPLSARESPQQKQLHGSRSSLNKAPDTDKEEPSIYLEAEITLSGLYALLSGISDQLDSIVDKVLYQGGQPAQSVRKEIISNANRGTMLNYMDSTSLSMIVIDQLPLLTAATEERCILPDNILFRTPAVVTESVIRSKIKPTSQGIWDRLFDHFKDLLSHRALPIQDIAEIFGPLIISPDSPYEAQAIHLLSKLLEEAAEDTGMPSPHSTSTFSATPRPKPQVLQKKHSSDEDEDIFDKEIPKHTETGVLTQTAAYRQIVGSTLSTGKSVSYIDSDEDSIEHQIEGKGKPSSPAKQQLEEHRRDSFKGASPQHIPGSPAREGALSPASILSGLSSPAPLSPASPLGGYIPSALGDTGKSNPGQSTLSSLGSTGKKPAFMYGDSDTDEDIDLPGTGRNQRPEDDDFYS